MNIQRKLLGTRLVEKVLFLCLAITQAIVSLPAAAGTSSQIDVSAAGRPLYKATWMWNTGLQLKNMDSTFRFLEQNGVNLVFLQVDADVPAADYGSFIGRASASGIEVHALGGAPDWVLQDHQVKMYKLIDWVKTYNGGVRAEQRFKGIHLDVEPFVLPEWYADTDATLGLWRDTVSGFVEEMRTETPGLVAGADLPVWLDQFQVPDGQGGRSTLSAWMIRTLDLTVLMAYRDNASDIIASVASKLDEAESAGKPLIVAVETLPNAERDITFYTKGSAQMLRDLGIVCETFGSRAAFAGYAVHDYDGWSRLAE